jgi:hypothetical protein
MSFFKKKISESENASGAVLLERHEKGVLNDESFLKAFCNATILYSTPFGDHKDGGSRLFALATPDNHVYLPVFSSSERMKEYYEKAGRCSYSMIEGKFLELLEMLTKVNRDAPVKMGIIIDPGYFSVTVNEDMMNTVISIIKNG